MSFDLIRSRMEQLDAIPTMPAILFPLIRHLDQPAEDVNVQKIVELISHDKSITVQCLHMANSPLFGRWSNIDNVRGAVVALGLRRVREIALSCSVMKLLPAQNPCGIDPRVFWEHSLGVALVSRRLARRIGFRDAEKAYLSGLLHDLGIVVNLLLVPEDFRNVSNYAFSRKVPFDVAETEMLGFTHCLTGALLTERWRLGGEITEIVRRHHDFERASLYRGLTALIHIADLICRCCGLGYGFIEADPPNHAASLAWEVLSEECPQVRNFGIAGFASEMDLYVSEVRRLVNVLFRAVNN